MVNGFWLNLRPKNYNYDFNYFYHIVLGAIKRADEDYGID